MALEGYSVDFPCRVDRLSVSACDFRDDDLPPLPLAEDFCAAALAAEFDRQMASEDEWDPAKRLWRQAWANAEFMFALPAGDPKVADCVDDVNVRLDWIDGDNPDFEQVFDTRLLEVYLPSLQLRQKGDERTARHKLAISRSIGGLITEVGESSEAPQNQRGWRAKAALHLICNRTDLEFHTASAREGRSRKHPRLNHDGYAIIDGTKVPVKMRGSRRQAEEYDETDVLYLPFRKTAMEVLKQVTGTAFMTGERADEIITWLQAEAYGDRPTGVELDCLTEMTNIVEAAIINFYEERQRSSVN